MGSSDVHIQLSGEPVITTERKRLKHENLKHDSSFGGLSEQVMPSLLPDWLVL